MNFRAWSGVSVFTVGEEYGFLFILLGPLLFLAPKRSVPYTLDVQISFSDFVTKSESPELNAF